MSREFVVALTDPRICSTPKYIIQCEESELVQGEVHEIFQEIQQPWTPLGRWAGRLRKLGLSPTVVILEEVEASADGAERWCWWLDQAEKLGWDILNILDPEDMELIHPRGQIPKAPARKWPHMFLLDRTRALTEEEATELRSLKDSGTLNYRGVFSLNKAQLHVYGGRSPERKQFIKDALD